MAVISINIEENSEQIVAGFPRTVALYSNIPANIFYTLDGSAPTTNSSVYISPITIPVDEPQVFLSIYATNGIDNSAVITKMYTGNIINNSRRPHAGVAGFDTLSQSSYPFSSQWQSSQGIQYLPPDQNPQIVNNPALPVIPSGYNADGNPTKEGTNLPLIDYLLIPTVTDSLGRLLPGVIPGNKVVVGRTRPVDHDLKASNRAAPLFNPRAMVIFQDETTEDKGAPPMINRHEFTTENPESPNSSGKLYATSLESPTITGSLLKSYYNPRTEMMTNYYRDSSTNRWIISSYPFQPKNPESLDFSHMVFPKGNRTVGKVFSWHLWQHRHLF